VRVPTIFNWPGTLKPGVVTAPVHRQTPPTSPHRTTTSSSMSKPSAAPSSKASGSW
jgi:hypothetical protein